MNRSVIVMSALLLCGGARSQATFLNYLRVPNGALLQKVVSSPTSDGGMILATLQENGIGIARLDADGAVLWGKLVQPTVTPGFSNVYTVAEIDDGPAFYVLAACTSVPFQCQQSAQWLVEVDDLHQVVFSNFYCHYYGSCGGSSLTDHNGEAHRLHNGDYFLTQPTNPNWTCLYGLTAGGDTLYCRGYYDNVNTQGAFAGAESLLLNDGSLLLLNRTDGGINLINVGVDGGIIWSKNYLSGYSYDESTAAIQLENDSILVTGIHALSSSLWWGFLMKMDAAGNVGWHRRFDLGDQASINPGWPNEITASSNGESVAYLQQWNYSYMVQFDQGGAILSANRLLDSSVYEYRSLRPHFSINDRLMLSGSTQLYGEPWWSDSILVAGTDLVADLTCGQQPVTWFDEPDPNQLIVTDNGGHKGSTWFRTGSRPVEVLDQDWMVEPYCLTTGVIDKVERTIWMQPTLVEQGVPVLIGGVNELHVDLRVLDLQGRVVRKGTVNGSLEGRIDTNGLASGIYTVVLDALTGWTKLGRFVVVGQ